MTAIFRQTARRSVLMLTDGFASMRKAMLIQLKKQKAVR